MLQAADDHEKFGVNEKKLNNRLSNRHAPKCGTSPELPGVLPGGKRGAHAPADLHRSARGVLVGRFPVVDIAADPALLPRDRGRRLLPATGPAAMLRQCDRLRRLRCLLPCIGPSRPGPALR